jgi:sec-independent protein translocase protein TatA
MRNFGLPELLVVLVIIILIFGIGRISKIAGELGSGVRAFKEGLSGKKDDEKESKGTDDHDIPDPS